MDFLTFLRYQWDRVAAVAAMVSGLVLLIVAWVGASRELLPAGQIPYVISGGLGGVFLLGLGAVLWLSADLRDEWRELRDISHKIDGLGGAATTGPQAVPLSSNVADRDESNGQAPARRVSSS
jgi:hypothetical protein